MIFNKIIISYYVWLAFVGMIIHVCAEAGNIVYNPGFECILSGVGDVSVPAGWAVSPSNISMHVVSTNYTHSGNSAVKLSKIINQYRR